VIRNKIRGVSGNEARGACDSLTSRSSRLYWRRRKLRNSCIHQGESLGYSWNIWVNIVRKKVHKSNVMIVEQIGTTRLRSMQGIKTREKREEEHREGTETRE
jgi:hypothetical protein